jgi:N-acetylmuramoyl-L-alanine amidase
MATPEDETLFQFWVYDYSLDKWTILQDYSSNKDVNWTPAKAGKYRVVLHVKNKYSKNEYDGYDYYDVDV